MKWKLLVWVLLGLVFIAGSFVAWEFTADDSFITFRYARNVADGLGLTWNPTSSDPVEGYTNFLWMAIMIIPQALHLSPVLFSKLVGLLFLLLTARSLYKFGARAGGETSVGLLAVAGLLFLPGTYFHALSGMETMLYAWLLLQLFMIGLDSITAPGRISSRTIVVAPILVLLAGLTRPEGLVPGAVCLGALFTAIPAGQRRRAIQYSLLLLVLPGLVYFVWRVWYFGWLLPNTFYIKFGDAANGLEWLGGAIGNTAPILLSALIFLLSLGLPRRRQATWFVALFLVGSLAVYAFSHLYMNYMNRFLFHVGPVLLLLLALGIKSLTRLLHGGQRLSGGREAFVGAALLFLGIWPLLHSDKTEVAHLALYESHLTNAHGALAASLRESKVPAELRTLAVGDAGVIPYLTDWTCFDFIGLNDENIAHRLSERSTYIANARPTVMILYSGDGKAPSAYQFGFEPGPMLSEYESVGYIKWFPNYYLALYVRKDIPPEVFTELSSRIQRVAALADQANAGSDDRRNLLSHLRKRLTGRA